ncbi:uncharacterized protein F4822DRAFT_194333 [Hypoxylon trugodes]|uniref:uncharacterized protein n=1 Tax=Hypoxylon trugodes TaxID=326681 RepID=UPI00218EF4B3|nr:uncharacterized protein F4822DRAFT_194333 [Hypoxylon trugodes]KAI1389248.1 hypothetical protein F4822DRAFT_194333 [Hypoxylon trugodes]
MQPATAIVPTREPASDPESPGTEISTFLQQFWEPMTHGRCPYVHPQVISFHSEQDRANWEEYMPDANSRDFFRNFAGSHSRFGRQTSIALLSIPNGSLVGDQWKRRPWHVFALAIINDTATKRKGKRILVWDCDPVKQASVRQRWRNILWGKQRSFIQYLRDKRHMKKAEIWYNIDASGSGKDKCLLLSQRKVWEWATLGDISYQGADDPRFQHCVRLKF